jgi:hypothetical protein
MLVILYSKTCFPLYVCVCVVSKKLQTIIIEFTKVCVLLFKDKIFLNEPILKRISSRFI